MRLIALLAATATLIGLAGPTRADPLPADRLIAAQGRLGFTLIERLGNDRGTGKNVVVSPASLAAVFALLDLGADAHMRAALHDMLGFGRGDATADFQGLRATITKIGTGIADGDATYTIANSLVFDPKGQPNADALDRMRATGAKVIVDSLAKRETLHAINVWVAEQTKGLISSIIDETPLPPGLVAVNALYFKGQWPGPFDKARTKPMPFHGLDGRTDVPMMHTTRGMSFRQDARFVAVDIAYKNPRFSVVVITTKDKPASAKEFASVAGWFGGEDFKAALVELALPRFKIEDGAELLATLDAMGLGKARTSPTAFAGLSPLPLAIDNVLQRTYLRVDEEGTEAAASTSVTVKTTALPPPPQLERVTVDKPFIIALRDRSTGLILIAAYIGRPDPIATASAR